MTISKRPLVSILFPVMNEAGNVSDMLDHFHKIEVDNDGYDFELVIVDDGSTDETFELLNKEMTEDFNAIIVKLSRNFGSHYAISAGMAYCTGDAVIMLGADLQEPLSLTKSFIQEWQNGNSIVWGIRNTRVANGLGRFFSSAFSKLFHRFSDIKSYPAEGPSGFLCDRKVIDEVNKIPERHRNILGLIAWSGFSQTRVQYDQLSRTSGESKWTTRKMINLAIDSFVGFSHAPIRFMSIMGGVVAFLGFIYAAFIVGFALFSSSTPSGWATVITVVLVLGGFQIMMLGMLGEYVWRGVDETRQRPLFIVEETKHFGESSSKA